MTFKDAMSLVPTSVSIISCIESSFIFGCTISSLVSVDISETSPEIMFVLRKNSQIGKKIQTLNHFTINVLSESQQDVAGTFAENREPGLVSGPDWRVQNDRFAELKDSRAVFNCSFNRIYSNHNADIYIGNVENYVFNDLINPLIYDRREFKKLS